LSIHPKIVISKLLVGFVFFAIFVAGIITGGFLMARWVNHNQTQKIKQQQIGVPPIGPFAVRQTLNQLDLTRDQRKAANRILLETGDTVRVLNREHDFAVERMQEDMDKILTPDQRVKFEQLKDAQRAKLQDQREKVRQFLEQLHSSEAAPVSPTAPASSGNAQLPVPAGTQTQPAPAH
jgi:Spy/CpxP family protein refolding chaperone